MIYRKPDGGLEKQYRDKGGRAVWERSSMANLFTRVSIRKFQDKKIEKKDLEYILRAAMAAPSAGNQQPWEFYVTDDKMLLQELSKTSHMQDCLQMHRRQLSRHTGKIVKYRNMRRLI